MKNDGELKFPVMAVNNAHSKYLFDNRYGTGQSVIEGILSATNMLIAGKTAVVVGYGWCGRGIANRLKGLGAKVIVVESGYLNPDASSGYHRALEATYDGCWVMSMDDAALQGDFFITATGNKHVIGKSHLNVMKNGAILANSGHFNHEIDLGGLNDLSSSKETILTNVQKYYMNNGRHLVLLAEGRLVNLAQPTGQGHPIEIMDGSFGIQALCVEYLAKNGEKMKPDIYDVPNDIDNGVAKIALESQGIFLDELSEEQNQYMKNWKEGT
jgi:adenosylhomocysteinase